MKKFLCGGLVLAAAFCVAGELIEGKAPEDFAAKPAIIQDSDGNLIPVTGGLHITKKSIVVDGKKKYRISFEYKNGEGNSGNAVGAAVAVPYDAKGRRIAGVCVAHIPKSEGKLVNGIKRGDTEVVLEVNPAWIKAVKQNGKRTYGLAVGAAADGADLPNFRIMHVKSQKIAGEARIVVKLVHKSPWNVKEGTMVRLHYYGWNGIGKTMTGGKEWKRMSFDISGFSAQAVSNRWWKGTKKAKLAIFASRSNGEDELLIRNFKLEEL